MVLLLLLPLRARPPVASVLLSLTAAACSTAGGGNSSEADSGTDQVDAGQVDGQPSSDIAMILSSLENDLEAGMLSASREGGWPLATNEGYLFVSTDGLAMLAGDHNDWQPAAMDLNARGSQNFYYTILNVDRGTRYKFSDGASDWRADPWSRSYAWDDQGEMSTVHAQGKHLERHFQVGNASMSPRRIRLLVPAEPASAVLYVHDGQNLFNPGASFGGWQLDASAPEDLLVVGIDNTEQRMNEYTHVAQGNVGGQGDAYADFVETTVRPMIDTHYDEPEKVGTMGSSLGGLISLHIADRYPDRYRFAASLSGTVGWGSIGTQGTDTIIKRYRDAGHRSTAIYIDSGGGGLSCSDSDDDGTNDDDPSSTDNYCENRQLESTLVDLGYLYDTDLWHWWEEGAAHNEAAWAARAFRPMQIFMDLE